MKFLKHILTRLPEYRSLSAAIDKRQTPAAVTGLSGIHKAHLIYSLCANQGRRAFVVASDEAEGQRLCNDLSAMGMDAMVYPARDFNFRDTEGQSREYEHQRLHVLARMAGGDYQVVISCIDAALQHTIPPEELRHKTVILRQGQEVPVERVSEALLASGYERYEQVEEIGRAHV